MYRKSLFNAANNQTKIFNMNELTLNDAIARSQKIRELYHELELQHHGSKWTVQEDALAFLTDAGLVGRLTMS